jgi:hypothetical protein
MAKFQGTKPGGLIDIDLGQVMDDIMGDPL